MTHFSFNSHFAHEPYCLLCAGREHLKKKERNEGKIYDPVGKFAKQAK